VSEEVFLLAVLKAVPDGSTMDMADDESERWVRKLQPWAIPKTKMRESQAYRIDLGFRHAVSDLLKEPADFGEIHMLGIASPEGKHLFSMQDNFDYCEMTETIQVAVEKELKSRTTGL
jgi:hypothetical protein